MITTNLDVEDSPVNGAIGILKHIEQVTEDEEAAVEEEEQG